jgi:arylsulfatase A-like enzyme
VNIIFVLIDSMNRHALTAYNPATHIQTPNLSAFAAKAWRMDNHFVGSLPCMPARREIFAGFKEMLWRPWGPLEWFDARLPRLLEGAGYSTAIVTDHYHYWEDPAQGYIQSFQSAELVRGHEIDFWKTRISDDAPVPEWVNRIERWRPGWGRWYYSNVKDFRTEEDFFPAKVFSGARAWLRENARKTPFFLQIESFDVHEPFHVPEPYASMYGDPSAADRFTLWPPYQNVEALAAFIAQASPEELEFVRAQYAAKLTMVDRWFGELTRALDELALWDDTLIIVTTDHGHDLAERGKYGKQHPHYDSHAHIPMLIWYPRNPGNGRSSPALTSTVDLFATALDAAGAPIPERTHSRSVMPVLRGQTDRHRDVLLYGTFGQGVCLTDGDWTIFKAPVQDEPLFVYSSQIFRSLVSQEEGVNLPVASGTYIPGVALPQWQIPTRYPVLNSEDMLFYRAEDPGQTRNLWLSAPDQRERMLSLLRDAIEQEGSPPEQWTRLGLER